MLKKCCSFVIILIVTLIRKGPLLPQNESLVFLLGKELGTRQKEIKKHWAVSRHPY
jgi:hypothetical protein